MPKTSKFPAGGPREPVYAAMRAAGFKMSDWSDKYWHGREVTVHIYGAGSRARVVGDGVEVFNGALESFLASLE